MSLFTYIPTIDIQDFSRELLLNLCIMFTVITLFSQYLKDRILELTKASSDSNRLGIVFFTLLAIFSMLAPLRIGTSYDLIFDLRQAVIILSTAYLGMTDSFIVGTFTIFFRLLLGGTGWVWWSCAVYLHILLACFLLNNIKSRNLGLLAAAVATTIQHMFIFALLSNYIDNYDYFSPSKAFNNFMALGLSLALCLSVSVLVLDKALKKILDTEGKISELKLKANIDGMTGLLNYRRFKEVFDALISTTPQNLAVLMADIDYFKRYNDTYGHEGGDEALRSVARILVDCVRNQDIVARYGGEEFVIVLPNTDRKSAYVIAERIRAEIASASFNSNSKLTISIGLCAYPDASYHQLVAKADEALYLAKRNGRNRVQYYTN